VIVSGVECVLVPGFVIIIIFCLFVGGGCFRNKKYIYPIYI